MPLIDSRSWTLSKGSNRSRTLPPVHLAYLDGLRALAALYVVMHHAWQDVMSLAVADPAHHVTRAATVFAFGHYAVDLFIVLSGFCLMIPVLRSEGELRGGAIAFYKRRVRRIVPPYYAAMALSLLLVWLSIGHTTGTSWDLSLPVSLKDVAAHALLIHNVYHPYHINSVFWSIAVECQIYLFFPLLVLAWRRFGPWATLGVAVVVAGALHEVLAHLRLGAFDFSGITILYYALFVMGMLGAAIAFSQHPALQRLRTLPWAAVAMVIGGGIGVTALRYGAFWTISHVSDLVVGVMALSTVMAAQTRPQGLWHRMLSWRPLVFVGTFAYSIYLIHAPLMQVFWQVVVRPLHLGLNAQLVLLAGPGLALFVAAAYVFFLLCERPFLTRRAVVVAVTPPADRKPEELAPL